MIKGHVEITLHNHNSGFKERIEGDNLITNALDYIIPNWIGSNNSANSGVMPLCSKALGGLMLFDGTLEENPQNIFFPSNVHLLASAGQSQLTAANKGSLNTLESYQTDTGFVTTWDFSTAQANGSIRSLARTLAGGGSYVNPMYGFYNSSIHYARLLSSNSINCSLAPLCYDTLTQTLYYIGVSDGYSSSSYRDASNVTHYVTNCTIYKQYIPTNLYGLADSANQNMQPEEVSSFTIDRTGSYAEPSCWFPGYDGYAYLVASVSNSSGDGTFTYWKMKISDYSFEVSEVQTVTARGCHLSNRWEVVSNGYAYIRSYDMKSIYIINLSNPVDVVQAALPEGYTFTTNRLTVLRNGGVRFLCYKVVENTTSVYEYHMGICYPDTKIVVDSSVSHYNSSSYGSTSNSYEDSHALTTDNLMVYGRYGSGYTGYGYLCNNYLGTIFNLSSPILKTAASSMKVVYTLTNVDG